MERLLYRLMLNKLAIPEINTFDAANHHAKKRLDMQSYRERLTSSETADYLLDYRTQYYLAVSPPMQAFSECSCETLQLAGLHRTQAAWHPDDWQTHDRYILPAILSCLKEYPAIKRKALTINFNYRVKYTRRNGQKAFRQIVQKSRYLEFSKDGLPELALGSIDHSNISDDSNVLQLKIVLENQTVFQQEFISLDHNADPITYAEERVLKLYSQGETYGAIKTRTGLTENTISTHLKNIRQKTGCESRKDLHILAKQLKLHE